MRDIITGQMSSLNSSQAGNLILKRVEVKISEDENVKGYRGIGSGNGLHGIFPWIRKDPEEKYSIEAIRNAYEHGCTLFDTAEVYSLNLLGTGHNELIVERL